LGAQRLNETVPEVAAELRAAGVQVLHVSGTGKTVSTPSTRTEGYIVVEYVDQMELAYAAADLVLGRAGANTVSELTALGLPAVYVPLPIGNGEQRLNVEPVVAAGGGLLVADADLTSQWLRAQLVPLLADAPRRAAMSIAAAGFGRLDADRELAALVGTAVSEGTGS
jgi:UDP-N-acetylglucosamine--N-acetylmuramyl-(pentapeptide) pyrophosphoryl-undecaprenol N-acetylglucosamine transferase